MTIRKAQYSDVDRIMQIIEQARQYMKDAGFCQWKKDYPVADDIIGDIDNGVGYVLTDDDDLVLGTMAVILGDDVTYQKIYEGSWLSDQPYGAIHRIAIDNKCKGMGLAGKMVNFAVKLCLDNDVHSLRTDTHAQNFSMQKMVKKNMFTYCGIIHLLNGDPRFAYERLI